MKSINEKMLNNFEGNNENKEKFNNIPISERKIKKAYIIIFFFISSINSWLFFILYFKTNERRKLY